MNECFRGHHQASTNDHPTCQAEANFQLAKSTSKFETLKNSFNLWSLLINRQDRKQAFETFQYKSNIQQASSPESPCSKLDQLQPTHEQQSSPLRNINSYSLKTRHSMYSNLSCSPDFNGSETNDNGQEFINRVDHSNGLDTELSNGSSNGTIDAANDDSSNTSSAYDGGAMSTERLIGGLDMIINGGECSPCSWCRGTSPKMFTLRTANGLKTFCSEICFAQCRRSSFKKNKVCDWCKHIRHTVNYVDFQDGSQQLQFCSDKCLNQYKMNVFCRETQAHINALHSQLNLPLRSSSNGLPLANSSQIENDSLITPESWLRGSRTSEHSDSSKSIDPTRVQSLDQCKISKSSHKENEHVSGRTISIDKSTRISHTIGNQKLSKNNYSKKISPDHVIDFSTKNQAIKRPEQRKEYGENGENPFLPHLHRGSSTNNLERFTDRRSTQLHQQSSTKSIFPPIFQSNFDSKTFSPCFPPLYPPPPPPPSGETRLSTNCYMNPASFTPIGDRFCGSDLPLFRHGLLPPPPFMPLRSSLPNMLPSSITEMNPMMNSSLPPRNSFGLHPQAINGKNSNTITMTEGDKNSIQKCFPLMPIMLPFPLPLPLPIPFPIPYNRSTIPNHFHHQATQTSYDDPEESLRQKSSKKIDPELKAQVNSLMNRLIHQNASFSRKPSTNNVDENDGQTKVSSQTDRIEQSNGKRKRNEEETQKFQQQFEKFGNNNEFSPNSQSIISRSIESLQSNKRIKKDLTVA
ncbi:sine oculis-binding protein [Brevipalpus obovatus]|uniref:sine oculis-binding protein n=1 Tax=Brevipalpus obovatus TaxID=246614 RepID=UPI003D9F5215